MAKVLILIGSRSDDEIIAGAKEVLDEFGVAYKLEIASAHRTPNKVKELASNAKSQGIKIIICGAGYAAHLAGAVAANTTLPVLGVPIDSSTLKGLDSLLSTVMMPSGVPVATFTIGKSGAKNAAIFAIQILALSDKNLAKKLENYKKKLAGS